MDAINMVLEP